jgi:hypothetical protein
MKKELQKIWKIYAVVFILIGVVFVPFQSISSTAASADDTEYWALLVAAGVYADNPQQDRPDMLREVDDLHDLLLQSDWWHEDHIKVIEGKEATVTNIISGLRWLDRMEDKNDISLVYLTTHGFPLGIDIPPKDEADGTDEALVSYWGFAYEKLVIYDDELNVLLNRLESKGVCLIVDSCYAGGFNDPPNWNLTSNTNNQQQTAAQTWARGFGEDVRGQNRVVLMASCEDELSYSGGFGPYVIDGLRGYADTNSDNIITAEEAFYYAEPRSSFRQHPTIYDGYDGELPLMMLTTPATSQEKQTSLNDNTFNKEIQASGILEDETSILCGYIQDSATTNPIENATVAVRGRINDYEYYENQTTTNAIGFYQIHTPAIRLRVTVSADGYCDRSVGPYQMQENTTRWANISIFERPPETAVIKGYITDEDTADPLDGVNISLFWQESQQYYYQNQTISDVSGYYEINAAAGNISLQTEKDGYFQGYVEEFPVDEYETVWMNISLHPRPLENAVICGYITDKQSGVPLGNARIDVEWLDINIGLEYGKETSTNASGYFTINIAPGELYIYIRENGYEYYDPYRHDVVENGTLWLNCSLPRSTIEVEIAKPLQALYRNNERIMPFSRPQIIGPIDIEAYIPGGWNQPGDAEKVEFYIDGTLQETRTEQPYNWTWSQRTFGKHVIKVIAYDFNGDMAIAELEVNKFL